MDLKVLTEGKTTKQLVTVKTHEKILDGINNYLSGNEFNYIVTVDNLKDVKSNNAGLNKSAGIIKEAMKKLVESESENIVAFKANIKIYLGLIEKKRLDRIAAIEVFESETKKILKSKLIDYARKAINFSKVREKFDTLDLNDLVVLGNLTSKLALTKKCCDSLDSRVLFCKSNQDKYDMRVLKLENICYKNGLESPLKESHIQGIINIQDDSDYEEKLNILIKDELKRHEEVKTNILRKEKEKNVTLQTQAMNNSFLEAYGMMSIEQLKEKLIVVKNIDMTQFNLVMDSALSLQKRAITLTNQAIYAKEAALKDTKEVADSLLKKDTPFDIVEPNHIDSNKEESALESSHNNGLISHEHYQEQKEETLKPQHKEYIINVSFKVSAPITATNQQIKKHILKELVGIGVNDKSLISLEVE